MLRLPLLSLLVFAILGFATACSDDDDFGASENATETTVETAPSPGAEIVDTTPAPPPPPPPDAPPDAPPPSNEPTLKPGPPIVTIEEPQNNSGMLLNSPIQLTGSVLFYEPITDPHIEWLVKYAGLAFSIGLGTSITWLPSDHVTVQCGGRIVEIVLLTVDGYGDGQDSIEVEVIGPIC